MCYFKIIIKNCLWSPLVLAKYQPSFFNICKTSLTLYFFISLNVLITQAKVRIIILSSIFCVKSIKSNTIFYVSLHQCPPKTAYPLKSAAKLRLFLQYQAYNKKNIAFCCNFIFFAYFSARIRKKMKKNSCYYVWQFKRKLVPLPTNNRRKKIWNGLK